MIWAADARRGSYTRRVATGCWPAIRRGGVLLGLIGLLWSQAGCSSSHRGLTDPCPPAAAGRLCINVITDHAGVTDVIGYLSASDSPLAGRTWRLALSIYPCDPGAGPPACAATATYPASSQTGTPPTSTYCRSTSGAQLTSPPGCHNTETEALATHDDFRGFLPTANGVPQPRTFTTRTWLCVSEQLRAGATWAEGPVTRACRPVG
jgi:hypothetical protein